MHGAQQATGWATACLQRLLSSEEKPPQISDSEPLSLATLSKHFGRDTGHTQWSTLASSISCCWHRVQRRTISGHLCDYWAGLPSSRERLEFMSPTQPHILIPKNGTAETIIKPLWEMEMRISYQRLCSFHLSLLFPSCFHSTITYFGSCGMQRSLLTYHTTLHHAHSLSHGMEMTSAWMEPWRWQHWTGTRGEEAAQGTSRSVQPIDVHCLIRAGLPCHTTPPYTWWVHSYCNIWRLQKTSIPPFSSTLSTSPIDKRVLQPARWCWWWSGRNCCPTSGPWLRRASFPTIIENTVILRSITIYKRCNTSTTQKFLTRVLLPL